MKRAVYPGSFDPITYGHIDIIKRAAEIFDCVEVSVLNNIGKTPLFSIDERVSIIKEVTKDIPNVTVGSFDGLLVDYCMKNNARTIIRGLRMITDFEYELPLAQTNRKLCENVDTVFLATSLEYAYLSSSTVKEAASFGGDISKFVPPFIADMIYKKYGTGSEERINEQ